MNLKGLANLIRSNTKQNAPALWTAGACVSIVATAYFAITNTLKAVEKLNEWEENNGVSDDPRERLLDRSRLLLPCYAPTLVSGAVGIGCAIAAHKTNRGRTIAALAQGAIAQTALDDYRNKAREWLGEKKDQEIMGKIAEDKIKENPPPGKDVVIAGSGHVLCCELYTGRYFNSDVETLKKAENRLNKKILSQDFQTLADFQYMIGLTPTSNSNNIGWTSSRLMELEISAILTNDDRPCLAFDYNYTVPV